MIKTSVIGSYAWPSWFITAVDAMQSGQYGPKDIEETLNDAVDLALREQEEAGIDILSDGEMRRLGFFTADFYGRLTGLTELPPLRRLGPGGHDQRERYEAHEAFDAPNGLGLVAEYRYASTRTTRPLKVPVPGPYTLAGRIMPGAVYPDRMAVAHRFAELINRELKALVAAGVDFIQLDEPSAAVHKDAPRAFIDLFNGMLEGVDARISVHLCFGNYIGRPVANRTFAPIFPAILDLKVDEFAIEFANREMAEIDVCAAIVEAGKDVAAGLVDVKNYFIETPEIVADRIRKTLAYVPAERLTVTPDCGFSQTARWAARAKMNAMVAGTRIVNAGL
ncbi:MAG: cobalamin-independent methionine synthase II family protein [Rhodothermales bacterium]